MTGLRDRKKQEARLRIIKAAADLFTAKGLDETTMEDVAAAADVSVGTVYNYFGSKNALLVAGVEEDTTRMVDRGAAVLARPGSSPVRAVQRLLSVYLDAFAEWDPALLREVISASFQRTGGAKLTTELVHMDERLIAQLSTLLAGFHDKGGLRPGIDPLEATMLLFSAVVTQLFIFISVGEIDAATLETQVHRQVEIAFGGLAAPKKPSKKAQ